MVNKVSVSLIDDLDGAADETVHFSLDGVTVVVVGDFVLADLQSSPARRFMTRTVLD